MLRYSFHIYYDTKKILDNRLKQVQQAEINLPAVDKKVKNEIKEWIKKDTYDLSTLIEYEKFLNTQLEKLEEQFGWMKAIKN